MDVEVGSSDMLTSKSINREVFRHSQVPAATALLCIIPEMASTSYKLMSLFYMEGSMSAPWPVLCFVTHQAGEWLVSAWKSLRVLYNRVLFSRGHCQGREERRAEGWGWHSLCADWAAV